MDSYKTREGLPISNLSFACPVGTSTRPAYPANHNPSGTYRTPPITRKKTIIARRTRMRYEYDYRRASETSIQGREWPALATTHSTTICAARSPRSVLGTRGTRCTTDFHPLKYANSNTSSRTKRMANAHPYRSPHPAYAAHSRRRDMKTHDAFPACCVATVPVVPRV